MGSRTIVRRLGGTNNRPPSQLSISKIALGFVLFYVVVTLKSYSYLEVEVREIGSGCSWTGCGDSPSTLMGVQQQQQAPNNINNNKDPRSIRSYDVVTLVHHDDMEVLIKHGLDSYFNYLTDFSIDGRMFVIGTPQAIQKIEHLKENWLKEKKVSTTANTHCDWDRVVTVPEYLFPFSLQDAKRDGHKPTWVYQQFLKMYSYQVLSGLVNTPLKRHFLLVDSDTTFVRPLKMLTNDRTKMLYNIASEESGAYKNDVMIGDYNVPLAFKKTLHKGFPKPTRDGTGMGFTSITHMMMIDGYVLNDMLAEIARLHRKPTWRALLDCCHQVTEWEFYMAYAMKHHRDRIGVRQLPYVNWGRVDDESLRLLRETKDVYYVSKHDDFSLDGICCVNSNWTDSVPVKCNCCEQKQECKRMKIDCNVLGIEGCQQSNDGSGVMVVTFGTIV